MKYKLYSAEQVNEFHARNTEGDDKIRNHFAVNRLAQAGALASLGDPAFLQGVVRQVVEGRREYQALAAELAKKFRVPWTFIGTENPL